MGKYEKDQRKYRKVWESTEWAKGWLQHIDLSKHKSPNDPNEAYCKICDQSLRSHLTDLQKHARSKKHKENSTMLDKTKYKSLMSHGKVSIFENLQLHRTKCSSLIKHVIAPVLLDNLVKAIGQKGYSIIIDESTDVSVTKYLCMCVRYFDTTENRILTDFLGILEVERATAIDLHKSIIEYLQQIGIPLRNMIAVSTDGASNLCGRNHSVYTLLKRDVPNLQLMRCTCHSLHLCPSKASEELPSSLDFLVREIFNWFSISPLRKINYKKTFDLINCGNDAQKRQMIQLSRTRWLAFYDVVKRLLEQWVELKTHFRIACDAEKCYTARTIRDMLEDNCNKLYLMFLKPILFEVQHLNTSFQSEKIDAGSLYTEFSLTFLSLARKILKPIFLTARHGSFVQQVIDAVDNDLAFLPVAEMDFEQEFKKEIEQSQISEANKSQIQQRCFNFLKRLLREMAQRLPANLEIFKKIELLSPRHCTSQVRVKFEELPLSDFFDSDCDVSVYKSQWEKLRFFDWNTYYKEDVPTNILVFWPDVYKYTDACGRFIFRELAEVVLKILTIPTSNAVVERTFSALTLIKSRIRNKLKTSMLQSLLRIRMNFQAHGKCCKTFQPSTEMIDRFKSSFMYESGTKPAIA
ncbi:PREDICTED: zinc finger MYM-type protein 1-like [Vollenhovia emeryi]|uniref:zinc finger MYM-type protein 1-like n=1 Tax=Vollenhovia emeryi TaxID=411798 RepID=UPI0005F3A3D5|nr:PREDICTED: zinc finger MYM-type protein 1-like [Vollenhovia emeryi]